VMTTGWTLQEAYAVSADGATIAGYGLDPTGKTQAWLAHIPITNSGTLTVTPGSTITFSGPFGGPFTSNFSQYTVANTGTGPLNYSVSPPSWLTVSPSSGSLAAGASTAVTVSANSSSNNIEVGNYSSTITFTNTTNGSGNTSRLTTLVIGTGIPEESCKLADMASAATPDQGGAQASFTSTSCHERR
jgi:hypothetical protein